VRRGAQCAVRLIFVLWRRDRIHLGRSENPEGGPDGQGTDTFGWVGIERYAASLCRTGWEAIDR
jgi:hypothetical protein